MFSCSVLYFQVIGYFSLRNAPATQSMQRVAAVVVDAVYDALPVVEVVGRHAHERDVVTPLGEWAGSSRRSGSAGEASVSNVTATSIVWIGITTSISCQ